MPLTITKLLAKCDVEGCDKQMDATAQQLGTQGWSIVYLHDGQRKIVGLHHCRIDLVGINAVACPSCSVQGHYKKMVKP